MWEAERRANQGTNVFFTNDNNGEYNFWAHMSSKYICTRSYESTQCSPSAKAGHTSVTQTMMDAHSCVNTVNTAMRCNNYVEEHGRLNG